MLGNTILLSVEDSGLTLVAELFERLTHMLVICPNSLTRNWAFEIEKFAPGWQTAIIAGQPRERRAALRSTEADVVIMNYALARGEIVPVRTLMRRLKPVLVLDESHHVKNRESLTSIATRHFAPLSEHRWLLTGTPVTNRPEDIHAQVQIVAGGNPLGPSEVFALDYGDADTNSQKRKELAGRLQRYLLRRTKEECLDLPDKMFVDLHVPLPPWQRQLYKRHAGRHCTGCEGAIAYGVPGLRDHGAHPASTAHPDC